MRVTKKPDVRKQELIDLARALFLEKGFDKVSVREIISQAESSDSPGLFYYYFKSKQEIYEAVLEQMADEMETKRLAAYEENSDHPVKAAEAVLEVLQNDILECQKMGIYGNDPVVLENLAKRLINSGIVLTTQILEKMLREKLIAESEIINFENLPILSAFLINGISAILLSVSPDSDRTEVIRYIRKLISTLLGVEF